MRKRIVVCADKNPAGRGLGLVVLAGLLLWTVVAPVEAAAVVRAVVGAVVTFIGSL